MLKSLRSDRGFTIIESSVALVIMGILLAAVYSVVIRVNQEASDQIALADTQAALRTAAHDIDVELRQATPDTTKGSAVQKLAWNEIQFLSFLNASSDLQLHRYWLSGSCATGCDLNKSVHARVPASDPPTYETTPLFVEVLASGVIASPSQPVFVGQEWAGASITDIAACDEGGGPACDFSLVEINLHADPGELRAVSDVVITEQVRIRNAK